MEEDKELWSSPWGIRRKAEMEEELQKSKGLGDTIEKFTKMTGIKKMMEVIEVETGGGCGCDKRKDKLNEIFPYKK
jgi:hypothetical protein|tara:strand:- start:612 stop:839 length:228 start_codon:yes stop_codon:yes gene_type:complete